MNKPFRKFVTAVCVYAVVSAAITFITWGECNGVLIAIIAANAAAASV